MASISYLDTLVTILSIIGGVFGGIPTIIKWISRPRFCIKKFELYRVGSDNPFGYSHAIFSIANEGLLSGFKIADKGLLSRFNIPDKGLLSKDATELEINCSLQNKSESPMYMSDGGMLQTDMIVLGFLSDDERIEMDKKKAKSTVYIKVLPRGTSSKRIVFHMMSYQLPESFKFFIYLEYREGRTILSRDCFSGKEQSGTT